MTILPFPEPDHPLQGILSAFFDMFPRDLIIDACGDLTVGEALKTLSEVPLKDVLKEIL